MDYDKLGFKCGLEIHQQLDTKKLFCNCQSVLRKDEPDFVIRRKLHAVAGESGKVDVAAEHEMSKDKEFVYQGYDTTCLVELDEEPPHEINKDALKIGLQISLLLNCKIIPLTQIMRKTVIDGSNTSGFQRTVLIARDGYVETEEGRVGIDAVILEEDAARIVSREDDKVVYKLDRLGIPLVEIVTAPDVKTAEQAKNVSLKIGEILRSCKVRRGIGTIRQDVSISIRPRDDVAQPNSSKRGQIKGGERIEMKGVQEPKLIVETIDNEIKRQIELVKKKQSVAEVRRGNKDATTKFLRPLPGAARMYPETDLPLLKISRNMINEVKKNLPRLRGEIEEELKSKGLNHEMIKLIFKQNKLSEFKELLEVVDDINLVAKVLLIFPKEIESKIKIRKKLDKDILAFVLERYKKGKIEKSHIKGILEEVAKGKDVREAVKIKKEDLVGADEKIMKIVKSKPGLSEKAYMGLVMKELQGKVDGKRVVEMIRKYITKD